MKPETFFSDKSSNYIKHQMNICIEDLEQKILLDLPQSTIFFNKLFEYIIDLQIPYEYEESLMSSNNDMNREYINTMLYKFLEDNGLNEDSAEHFIFDNIRHAFINFKQGGIINMYQYREAEVWYPKVKINSFLGNKQDIYDLGENVKIFRGTSLEEYDSNIFGQSWSLSKKVAEDFAFVHYRSQPDYQNTERVVLEAVIDNSNIFFYIKNGRENEVIVNNHNLKDISIIEKKRI